MSSKYANFPKFTVPEEYFGYIDKRIVNWNGRSYQCVNKCEHSHPAECKDGHWYLVTSYDFIALDEAKGLDWKDHVTDVTISDHVDITWTEERGLYHGSGYTPPLKITGYSVKVTIEVRLPIGTSEKVFTVTGQGKSGYDYREADGKNHWNSTFNTRKSVAKDMAENNARDRADDLMQSKVYDAGLWKTETAEIPYEFDEDLLAIFNQSQDTTQNNGGTVNQMINNAEPDKWIDMQYMESTYSGETDNPDDDFTIKHFAFYNPRTGEYIYDKKDLPEGADYEFSQSRYDYQKELIDAGFTIGTGPGEVSLMDQSTLGPIPAPGAVVVEGETNNSVIVVEPYGPGDDKTIFGCMDTKASNFNPAATLNNPNDCEYEAIDPVNTTITGSPSNNIFDSIPETTELSSQEFNPALVGDSSKATKSFSAIGTPKWVKEFDLTNANTVAGTIYGTCEAMEESGALYIGDLLFSIPPVSMHFSQQNQTADVVTMRTKGDPTVVNNNTIPRVNLTLYFNGEKAINQELRPLMAMFQNAPFTTLQNTTVYDNWIARQDLMAKKDSDDEFDSMYNTRCEPVPAYLESINFTTVPGFPNTIQAHLSIIFMNSFPYGIAPLFWKYTEDAFKEAVDAAVRYDQNNVLVHIPTTETSASGTDEFGEPSNEENEVKTHFTYLLGGTGQHYKITTDDELADPTKVTGYPQYSWPYQKLYKNCLSEYPDAYKSGKTIDPLADWPIYKREDNHDLFLTYHSAKKLSTVESNFAQRLNEMNKRFQNLEMLGLVISNGITGNMTDFFSTVKEIKIDNFMSELLGYMSLSQTIADAKETLASFQNAMISELNQNLLSPQGQPITDENGVPISVDPVSAIEIIDQNGKIKNPISDLFESLSLSYNASLEQGRCDTDPDVNITEDACIDAGGNWRRTALDETAWKENLKSITDIVVDNFTREYTSRVKDSTSSVMNYQEIAVKFGWNESALIGNSLKDLANYGKVMSVEGDSDPALVECPGVVQSISYSYVNNVAPVWMASATIPTYQHMGSPNPSATITLRVRDERVMKIFTDMRVSSQEMGNQAMAGHSLLYDLVAGKVGGTKFKDSPDGHLLNCIGFRNYIVRSVDSRSIEGFPGWWEITIDIIQNDQQLRKLERKKLAEHKLETNYINILEHIFPSWKVTSEKILEAVYQYRTAIGKDPVPEEDQSFSLTSFIVVGDAYTDPNFYWTEEYTLKDMMGESMHWPYIWWDGSSTPGTFRMRFTNEEADNNVQRGTAWNTLLRPVMNHCSKIVNNYVRFLATAEEGNGYHSLAAGLISTYKSYLERFVQIIIKITSNETGAANLLDNTENLFPRAGSGSTFDDENPLTLEGVIHRQHEQSAFIDLIRTSSFRKFLIAYQNELEIPEDVKLKDFFDNFYVSFNGSISPNYPDLRMPDIIMKDTGVRIMSPGFPYVDRDLDLDVIEMEKVIQTGKLALASQMAALLGNMNQRDMSDIEEIVKQNAETVEKTIQDTAGDRLKYPSFIVDTDGKLDMDRLFGIYKKAAQDIAAENAVNEGPKLALFKDEGNQGVSKERLVQTMTATAITDYIISVMACAQLLSKKTIDWNDTDKDVADIMKQIMDVIGGVQGNVNISNEAKEVWKGKQKDIGVAGNKMVAGLLQDILNQNDSESINLEGSGAAERFLAMAEILYEKREQVVKMCSIAQMGDFGAFLNFFGIGDVHNSMKSLQLINQMKQYLATKRKSTMDRAFPTFKIFFIEEDSYVWHAFDDFYTYDAASEITIVESKHAASKTAILKLSNITSRLTGHEMHQVLREQNGPSIGDNLRIRVGTQLMIYMGYGADFRHLRMKFKGAITELNSGPILEITAQSWGAGLLNNVGTRGPTKYSSQSGATTLGAVAIDVLAQTPGTSHLGKWEIRSPKLNDPSKVAESTLKRSYWAKAVAGMFSGTIKDLMPVDSNAVESITGVSGKKDWFMGTIGDEFELPTTGAELNNAYFRSNNAVVRSFGNSLFDNICINDTMASGYGFFNMLGRLAEWDGFQWYVADQSAWEALNEIGLFMGDYILTTLPFNEGSDMLTHQPRETLYFGPREGVYKAAYNNDAGNGLNGYEVLADMVENSQKKAIALKQDLSNDMPNNIDPVLIEVAAAIDGSDDIIEFGKRLLYRLITQKFIAGSPADRWDSMWGFANVMNHGKWKTLRLTEGGLTEATAESALCTTFLRNRFDSLYWMMQLEMGKLQVVTYENITYNDSYSQGHETLATFLLGDFNSINADYDIADIVKNERLDEKPAAPMSSADQAFMKYLCELYKNNPELYRRLRDTPTPLDAEDGEETTGVAARLRGAGVNFNFIYDAAALNEILEIQDEIMNTKEFKDFLAMTIHHKTLEENDEYNISEYMAEEDPHKRKQQKMGYWDPENLFTLLTWPSDLKPSSDDEIRMTSDSKAIEHRQETIKAIAKYGYEFRPNGATFIWQHAAWYGQRSLLYFAFRYLATLHENIIQDTMGIIDRYRNHQHLLQEGPSEGPMAGPNSVYVSDDNPEGITPRYPEQIFLDVELALKEMLNMDDLFNYKPVVQFHGVNSWEDIISNEIVASADSMYNHAEILYNSEPTADSNISTAELKTSAMLSYDQDLDYLRTYSVFMKNLDPNWFLESSQAKAYTDAGTIDPQTQHGFMLTPNRVAQNVLKNVVKPMYQGKLTLLGNSHIRPWDIVHLHDDSIEMFGMVEVEEVVTTMSANEGFTTTVVPNLLVYDKHMSKSFDATAMSVLTGMRNLSLASSALWTAFTAGTGFWFLNHYGGKMGRYVTKAVTSNLATTRIGQMNITLASLKKKIAADGLSDAKKLRLEKKIKRTEYMLKHLNKVKNNPKAVLNVVKNVGKKGKFALAFGKLSNIAGWIWLAYDLVTFGWDWWAEYQRQKIHTASLLAGDNQLVWLPLEYQGQEYVAGLEGIVGGLRSANTMVYGELSMDGGANRFFYVLDNAMMAESQGLFDKDPRRLND